MIHVRCENFTEVYINENCFRFIVFERDAKKVTILENNISKPTEIEDVIEVTRLED